MKATICFILVSLSISLAVVRSQEKNASSVVQASLAVAPEGKADSGGEQESRRDAEELYEKAIQLRYTTKIAMNGNITVHAHR